MINISVTTSMTYTALDDMGDTNDEYGEESESVQIDVVSNTRYSRILSSLPVCHQQLLTASFPQQSFRARRIWTTCRPKMDSQSRVWE